jgi:hypothetical protein
VIFDRLCVFTGIDKDINIFHDFKHIYMKQTLPTYGFGLRWEFKPRVNVRVDWGFTKTGNSIVFNIGEAF